MIVETKKRRGVTVVCPVGRLTLRESENDLLDRITEQLAAGERQLVLNLTGLSVMDSSGVGEVVAAYKRAVERGAVFKIVLRPDGVVHRVVTISGLDRAFEIFEEEDAAVASFR